MTKSAASPEAVAILRELHAMLGWALAEHSRRGYFAALYTHVATAIDNGVRTGVFQRPDLLLAVHHTFFARYQHAFDARREGLPTTAAWQAAFDAADRTDLCVVQHLLLG